SAPTPSGSSKGRSLSGSTPAANAPWMSFKASPAAVVFGAMPRIHLPLTRLGSEHAREERPELLLADTHRLRREGLAAGDLAAAEVLGDGGVEEDQPDRMHHRLPDA